jgi:hypothetical protein
VQRDGETLDELLSRLDAAILDGYENKRFADEIMLVAEIPTLLGQ